MKNIINATFIFFISFNSFAGTLIECDEQAVSDSIINPNLHRLVKGTKSALNNMADLVPNSFVLVINNQCSQLMTLAVAFDGQTGLDVGVGKIFNSEPYARGWWLIKAGTTQELKIDHTLNATYFLHARTPTVFWGKDKDFSVALGGQVQNLKFSGYEASKKCEFVAAKGSYYCTHTFKCN